MKKWVFVVWNDEELEHSSKSLTEDFDNAEIRDVYWEELTPEERAIYK